MQNAFSGVLDKKRDIELGVEQLSKEEGFGIALCLCPAPRRTPSAFHY